MSLYDIGALPIGFTMRLSQDLKAMENFAAMSEREKIEIVNYIQGATTGEEAEERVTSAVARLHNL